MIPHLAWRVISTVKTNFIIWETRDWSWKPANFSTKPLAETQWKRADTFKSTEALRKHETMPPFSSYTFPVVTLLLKRDGILNHQVSATFPNCGNTLFHPVACLSGKRCDGVRLLKAYIMFSSNIKTFLALMFFIYRVLCLTSIFFFNKGESSAFWYRNRF